MKVKELVITLRTEKDQAQYFFRREFDAVDLDLIIDGEVIWPSDEVIVKEYLSNYRNEEELRATFEEEVGEGDFYEWVSNLSEFEDYKWGDFTDSNYPMWNTLFACDNFYINSDYCDIDKLYELGIGVWLYEDQYYLFIAGAGYDFYDAHWIPLFKMLNWIEYDN